MRNGAHTGTHYKFTALHRHGPSLSISDSGVSHLGLLWYSQEIDSRTKNLTFRGTEVLLCGRERHTMNGFFFVTTYNDPALDPVVFSLRVSDDGAQWERIFHSRSKNGWPVSIIPYSSKTTMKRGAMEVLDLRYPEPVMGKTSWISFELCQFSYPGLPGVGFFTVTFP